MEFHTRVAGVTYDNRQSHIMETQVGERIQLVREAHNHFDRNAIKVINAMGHQIGYIPKELAAKMARNMDRGLLYSALIKDVQRASVGGPYGVVLLVSVDEGVQYGVAETKTHKFVFGEPENNVEDSPANNEQEFISQNKITKTVDYISGENKAVGEGDVVGKKTEEKVDSAALFKTIKEWLERM